MIIVDKALERRESEGHPIRVGMVGAGFMGRGIAWQICRVVPGMTLVAISARSPDQAIRAYREAGVDDASVVTSSVAVDKAVQSGRPVVVEDPTLLCQADTIDAIIEVTGAVEFGARVAREAIEHRKHLILMNAELDGTVGPILKTYADRAGVVITNADGDQPGVIMNLFRFVRGIGVRPVLCGNIKGLQDPYRNPTTQAAFARQWKQKPHMVTSFADGSKISFEQAIVANATGMTIGRRGMFGPTVPAGTPLGEVMAKYPQQELLEGPGIVDYVVGAEPSPGVFVLGAHPDPGAQHYLNLYKLGEGPLYCFYTPYHLCHFEVANTVARAVLFADAAITPIDRPRVDVVATAKRDLKRGETLDGIGFYMTYGQCETAENTVREKLLPMGLAEGCVLRRHVARDEVLRYDDVDMPKHRLSHALRQEQDRCFFD